ncbi:hypothetical protein HDV00_001626 [Rhizophlyctis rosea]|nr:hypothetical protein HDV00_001626 [Rhizophlyctis rosea]
MTTLKEKQQQFETLLSGPETSATFEEFRRLCFQGICDSPKGLRPKCWKILLGYLPWKERARWDDIVNEQRTLYYTFVKEFIKDLSQEELEDARKGRASPTRDHPLNNAKDSKWQSYFEELTILEQIDKDCRRTLPDIAFFQLPIKPTIPTPLHPLRNESLLSDGSKPFSPIQSRRALFKRLDHLYNDDDFGARTHSHQHVAAKKEGADAEGQETTGAGNEKKDAKDGEVEDLHWEAVERILFIFAKLNPGVGYIQGMNEILAPLYYVLANDTDDSARAHAEADSFFAFSVLMGEFRDHFIRSLDNVQPHPPSRQTSAASLEFDGRPSAPNRKNSIAEQAMEQAGGNGVGSSMARLMKRLKKRDLEVWKDMQRKQIHPTFFSFRWLTVLLTQEFDLPDVIRIWDSLLADIAVDIEEKGRSPTASIPELDTDREGHFDFLIDFCCAMLVCIREELLSGSFADNIKLLQNYPTGDINAILQRASAFRETPLSPTRSESENWEQIDASSAPPLPLAHPDEILFSNILYPGRSNQKDRSAVNGAMWSNILDPQGSAGKLDLRKGLSNAAAAGGSLLAAMGRDMRKAASAVAVAGAGGASGEGMVVGTESAGSSAGVVGVKTPATTGRNRAPSQASSSIALMGDSLKEGFSGFLSRVRSGASTTNIEGVQLPPPPSEMPDDGVPVVGGGGGAAPSARFGSFMKSRLAAGSSLVSGAVGKLGSAMQDRISSGTNTPVDEGGEKRLGGGEGVVGGVGGGKGDSVGALPPLPKAEGDVEGGKGGGDGAGVGDGGVEGAGGTVGAGTTTGAKTQDFSIGYDSEEEEPVDVVGSVEKVDVVA